MMLLGFPLDYWNNDSIQNTLGSFGGLIMWENDRDHLARLMVRARVSDLTEVEGFQEESWTVQVEIVEQEMLGALPGDEEHVPVLHDNGQPLMFEWWWSTGRPD
jgi:hypothetical protein